VYIVRDLSPGVYKISAEAAGFEKAVVEHVVTEIDKVSSADVKLTVGAVTEQVTVEAAATLITTTGGAVGTLVGQQQIETLPLNGRNWQSLVYLSPGAVAFNTGQASGSINVTVSPMNFAVNGLRPGDNLYFIDGVSQTDEESQQLGIIPPLDALSEFRVETSNFSAEYFGGGSAVVSAATKTGTDLFHGSAWEYIRNDVLDSRNFFDATVPPLKRNQFGGTLGGPIRKDKTFFFGSYEGFRQVKGTTFVGNMPTAADRSGNLSDIVSSFSGPLTNPYTLTPFSDNTIPAGMINTLNANWMNSYVPLPNYPVPVGSGNYRRLGEIPIVWNTAIARVDEHFSDKSSLFGRFMYTGSHLNEAYELPLFNEILRSPTYDAAVDYQRSITPTTILEARIGWHYYNHTETSGEINGANMSTALGVACAAHFTCAPDSELNPPGGIAPTPFDSFSGGFPGRPRRWYNTGFFPNVSLMMTRGSHSLRIGTDVTKVYAGFPETLWPNGSWSYNGFFSGSGMGDYLLGLPRSILTASPFYPTLRRWAGGGWVQDDWKVTSKLKVNLGFRFDVDGRYSDKYNRLVSLDLSTPPTATFVLSASPISGYNRTLVDTPKLDPAPRIGYAYQLRTGTVIRGAYGIFFQPETEDTAANLSVNAPYVTGAFQEFDFTTLPTFNRANPLANAGAIGLGVYAVDRHFKDPNSQQWNLSVEQALGPNNLIAVTYIGNKGTHLNTYADPTGAPPGPGPITPRRAYTNVGSVTWQETSRDSSYQGFQAKFERRALKDLTLTVAYAFGKSIDDASGTYIEAVGDSFQDVRDPSAERGLSLFDVRQTLTFGYSYPLPLGAGQKLASGATGVAGKLISGWELSGLTTLRSGFPESTYLSYDNLNTGTDYQSSYPNRTCNPNNFSHANHNAEVTEWFNTACYAVPLPYVYGNAGRQNLIGPGLVNWDFSLFKKTTIRERVGVEFRAEFFNLFNRPDFGQPDSTLGPGFGEILGTSADSREIQFGLKFSF